MVCKGRTLADPFVLLLAVPGLVMGQQCSPQWESDAFGVPGVPAPYSVNRFAVWDDGMGASLYATGPFIEVAGKPIRGVAKWDGLEWSALGMGVPGRVSAAAVFDDGTGSALYVGGTFSQAGGNPASAVARWNGQAWSPLGSGLGHTTSPGVFWMTSYNNGAGESLYVGGVFSTAGGQPARHLARWDGTSWHNIGDVVGPGASGGSVNAILGWDDGTGPALYIGGNIDEVGGVAAAGIARLDASGWNAVGGGVAGGLGRVNQFAVYDDGSGEALYVAGVFTHAGGPVGVGIETDNLARWDGTAWSALPGGGVWEAAGSNPGGVLSGAANSMTSFDDGDGPALFVGGDFKRAGTVAGAGGSAVSHIARWKDGQWSSMQGGIAGQSVTTVSAMAVHDDGMGLGPALHVGGGFTEAGGLPAFGLARWVCFGVCYANCDGSTTEPVLNVDDFTCFISEFAAAQALPHEQQVEHYANCDGSTAAPVLNVDDFTCFVNAFAAGCS